MNQLTHCLAAKITGIVIFVLMCCIALISAILTYMAYYLGSIYDNMGRDLCHG